MSIKVVTDSTSYIDVNYIQELDINVIPLSVNFPDESFKETEVSPEYFYQKIDQSDTIPHSSQPSQEELYNTFLAIIKGGHEVLAIFMSSILSGTYESALVVKNKLLKEYPEANIEVLDSRNTGMALGLTVLEAAQAARMGQMMKEVVELAKKMIKSVHFYFMPATLEYLKKGGRIGGASALIGSILDIKPILFVNNGRADIYKRCRSLKNAQKALINLLETASSQAKLKYVIVHHINALQKAQEIATIIADKFHIKAPIYSIGPVIGAHVGPGSVGIVFSAFD